MKNLLFLATLLTLSFSAAAKTYKCTVGGQTTYSQTRCKGEVKQFKIKKLSAKQKIHMRTDSLRVRIQDNLIAQEQRREKHTKQARQRQFALNRQLNQIDDYYDGVRSSAAYRQQASKNRYNKAIDRIYSLKDGKKRYFISK